MFGSPLADTEWKLCIRPLLIIPVVLHRIYRFKVEDRHGPTAALFNYIQCLGPVRQQRLSVRSRNSRFNTVLVADEGFEPPTFWL